MHGGFIIIALNDLLCFQSLMRSAGWESYISVGSSGENLRWSRALKSNSLNVECVVLCNVTFSKSLKKIGCSYFEDKQRSAPNTYSDDLNAKSFVEQSELSKNIAASSN